MRSHANTSILLGLALAAATFTGPAPASLRTFKAYTANLGYGFGSISQSGTILASVPIGSTVVAANLYSATSGSPGFAGGTLSGAARSHESAVANTDACCALASQRTDVTSIVKPIIDGRSGGTYNFPRTGTSSTQDGEALATVYTNPSFSTATFGIHDGFARASGDTTAINFAEPLDPKATGFFAETSLDDGPSCCSQMSTVTANGTTITRSAGNNDDSVDGGATNDNLITVGGFDDPYSGSLPSDDTDHERYDLVPHITAGGTSITVNTINSSSDDNVSPASFHVGGIAANQPPTDVPEPGSLGLFGIGLGAMVLGLTRRNRRHTAA